MTKPSISNRRLRKYQAQTDRKNYQHQAELSRQKQTLEEATEDAWESHKARQENKGDWERTQQKLAAKSIQMLSMAEKDFMEAMEEMLNLKGIKP